ncbi:MAG: AMP-binding protein, partial [bacterium]|nr:AMP-binding protein [bacterium]
RPTQHHPEDPLYIYFTSGSTGTPKAILGKNSSLVHFIDWEIDAFGIDETWRFSQLTTPGFDAFLRDLFVPLTSGGVVCIPESKETQLEGAALHRWLEESRIHLISCVPSLFRLLTAQPLTPDHFNELRVILLSGERITATGLEGWFGTFNEGIRLVNLWGTSETTLAKTWHIIQEEDLKRERIPVGQPIRGASVFVLDENLEIRDPLVTGQLYIRTPYRSFGYYNDDETNRLHFIPNPFGNDPGDLIHHTGDMGRILPDGTIDLLGRNDRQIKLRGIRIEPGEIETQLQKHPSVKEAAVIKKGVGNEFLCAYVTVTGEELSGTSGETFTDTLSKYMKEKLPAYMVPSHIGVLEDIPRTPNGKVNYDALMAWEDEKESYIAPANKTEQKLHELWTGILKLDPISASDNFFTLGGNSLNIMNLISTIHREFDVRIPLADIFNNPTIQLQAGLISAARYEEHRHIEVAEERDYYALSSTQKRLYILHQMDPDSISYNMPQVLELEGMIDPHRLEKTFQLLIRRHDSFRTHFTMVAGEPVQKVWNPVDLEFEIGYYELEEEKAGEWVNRFSRPFDLRRAPLLRATLIKVGETRHILAVDMHHIISDGVSLGIVIRDFMALFDGKLLAPLRLQYKDFAQWQNHHTIKQTLRDQETYWLNRFSHDFPVISLPTDYARPPVQLFEGETISFALAPDQSQVLKGLALDREVSVFMALLAIFNLFLAKVSGQEDVVIGTGIEGRGHEDLAAIIGMFVNTLALRNFPAGEKSFTQFLEELKKHTLEDFQNPDWPFENIVEGLGVKRDTSRNPLFDVMFQFNNYEMPELKVSELSVKPYRYNRKISKFDLTLWGWEGEDQLTFAFEYSTQLFKRETIDIFVRYFKEIITGVIQTPQARLRELQPISAENKEQLLQILNQEVEAEVQRMMESEQVLQHRLARSFEKYGHNIAVEYASRTLTYGELDRYSNRVAHAVIGRGIGKGNFIGVLMDDRTELICTALGILKVGGVFVPLDTSYPQSRLELMAASTGIKTIIAGSAHTHLFADNPGILNLAFQTITGKGESCVRPTQHHPEDPLYIYFTSG